MRSSSWLLTCLFFGGCHRGTVLIQTHDCRPPIFYCLCYDHHHTHTHTPPLPASRVAAGWTPPACRPWPSGRGRGGESCEGGLEGPKGQASCRSISALEGRTVKYLNWFHRVGDGCRPKYIAQAGGKRRGGEVGGQRRVGCRPPRGEKIGEKGGCTIHVQAPRDAVKGLVDGSCPPRRRRWPTAGGPCLHRLHRVREHHDLTSPPRRDPLTPSAQCPPTPVPPASSPFVFGVCVDTYYLVGSRFIAGIRGIGCAIRICGSARYAQSKVSCASRLLPTSTTSLFGGGAESTPLGSCTLVHATAHSSSLSLALSVHPPFPHRQQQPRQVMAPTFWNRLWEKTKKDPLIPIGCTATLGCLTAGLYAFKSGEVGAQRRKEVVGVGCGRGGGVA